MSHPVRVRGLKLTRNGQSNEELKVAPRAGAWIETSRAIALRRCPGVAPRAGAWIETLFLGCNLSQAASHPVRVRGLKHFFRAIT